MTHTRPSSFLPTQCSHLHLFTVPLVPPTLAVMALFQGLAQYGNGFLAKFEAASCANKLLEEVTLVDTPGVLSGEKQRIERTYNFIDVCGWFAARCDLILLLFDPHKLDISDEFKQVCNLYPLSLHATSVSFSCSRWAAAVVGQGM